MNRTGKKWPTKPCDNCPFIRNGIKLHPGRVEELGDTLRRDGHFHCHKTVDYSGDEPSTADAVGCAGFTILQARENGAPGQLARVMERIGVLDYEALNEQIENNEDVYSDLDECMTAHEEEFERRG